jgi:hypothetical protein
LTPLAVFVGITDISESTIAPLGIAIFPVGVGTERLIVALRDQVRVVAVLPCVADREPTLALVVVALLPVVVRTFVDKCPWEPVSDGSLNQVASGRLAVQL